MAVADDSLGSSAVAPAASSAVDEDAIPENMSFEQKKAEVMRQLLHGPDPLMMTVEWRQIVQGLTPVERNPLAPPPLTWASSPPSQYEKDYFQFIYALDLRAFATRVQRSGLGKAALRIFLLRVHAFMLHLGRASWFQVLANSCNHYGILAIDAFTACLFEHEADLFNDDGLWGEMHAAMCVGRPWTAFLPPPGKGRVRPLGIKFHQFSGREYRGVAEGPAVSYEFRSSVMPKFCFVVVKAADLCGCGGVLRHGLSHPRFAALLRGELPEWVISYLRREGAAFPPGIRVWVGDPNTVQLGWPGIPADGEVLLVLHFRGLPSTVAVHEYHGDGMYPGFFAGGRVGQVHWCWRRC